MNYKTYFDKLLKIDDKLDSIFQKKKQLTADYISDNLPFPFVYRQEVKLTLRATDKSNNYLLENFKRPSGSLYSVVGEVVSYEIDENGSLRPSFFGSKPHYPWNDEIVAIELISNPIQCLLLDGFIPDFSCSKCNLLYCSLRNK